MKLWQILKGFDEGKYVPGDRFAGTHPEHNDKTYLTISMDYDLESFISRDMFWFNDDTSMKLNPYCLKYDWKKVKKKTHS
jgi:hypothetical protein